MIRRDFDQVIRQMSVIYGSRWPKVVDATIKIVEAIPGQIGDDGLWNASRLADQLLRIEHLDPRRKR